MSLVQIKCDGPPGDPVPDDGEFVQVVTLSLAPPNDQDSSTVLARLEQLAEQTGAIIDAKVYTFALGLDMARQWGAGINLE
jgi:hypothetical protein